MKQSHSTNKNRPMLRSQILTLLVCIIFAVSAMPAAGQNARAEFDTAIEQWRKTIVDAHETGIRFFDAGRLDSSTHKEEFDRLSAIGKNQLEALIPLALKAFEESKSPDPDLDDFVARIQFSYFENGRFEKSYQLCKRLVERNPNNTLAVLSKGRASILTNRFDEAIAFQSKHQDIIEQLPTIEKNIFRAREYLATHFAEEIELRKRDAEADDLPRVQIKTTKGTIIVELFENEAPDTVGNFIQLVESGFYDETIFHRVIYKFMAQGGGFTATAEKKTPYKIYDECTDRVIRRHFRGVLSMAKTGEPDSGNTQFFICNVPTGYLDGQHTVFGRVIEGLEIVDQFTKTFRNDPEEEDDVPIAGAIPDRILSTNVLRKRDHEYKPNKVTN